MLLLLLVLPRLLTDPPPLQLLAINPRAQIVRSTHSDVDLGRVLGVKAFDLGVIEAELGLEPLPEGAVAGAEDCEVGGCSIDL